MSDEFSSLAHKQLAMVKSIFTNGDYLEIFGFLEWSMRHKDCLYGFADSVDNCLKICHAAYRLIDERTIAPISSEDEKTR